MVTTILAAGAIGNPTIIFKYFSFVVAAAVVVVLVVFHFKTNK